MTTNPQTATYNPDPQLEVPVIQMANITKSFPGVVANDDVSLAVRPGVIHAIVGENGAGKSTLMGILYGRYQPDEGRIRIGGNDVRIDSPARAIALGIGMVTQHTTMAPALSVLENTILGAEPSIAGIVDSRAAAARVTELARSLGIEIEPGRAAGKLSLAALQKAEIVKALYRGATILILDEPTATLAPLEADALFALLHRLAESGTTIIFITHKLREVMAHASRVTVLRGGRSVGERSITETDPDELLALMIGRRAASPSALTALGAAEKREESTGSMGQWVNGSMAEQGEPVPAYLAGSRPISDAAMPTLEVRGVSVAGTRGAAAIRQISLSVMPGEVLGIAGVDGSGQRELAEAIVGLRPLQSGSILLDGEEIGSLSVGRRLRRGVTFIPEDRQREGLILDFAVAENLLLGRQRRREFGGGSVLDLPRIEAEGEELVRASRVKAPGAMAAARGLSGGNQQKVVNARALRGSPRLLVAMQPTRGLDVDAARFVYEQFRFAQDAGLAILLFSLDLDEVFAISNRIGAMFNGDLMGVVPRAQASMEGIGQMMVGGSPARPPACPPTPNPGGDRPPIPNPGGENSGAGI